MRRAEGPQTPYEVYCYHCHVTFPVEARRCTHCGQRLSGREGRSAGGSEPTIADRSGSFEAPADEETDEAMLTIRRFGVPVVWALVAVSAVLSNMCQGR